MINNIKWDLEIWKPIDENPKYEVSNMGRVRNKYKVLKPAMKYGYQCVKLHNTNGLHLNRFVHRLVATAFLDNPYNLPQVNHINEDKTDNRVENLEWCTAKYNNNYGTRINKVVKTLSKPIIQFTVNGDFLQKWDSAKMVEKEKNISSSHITECCNNKRKTAYGYKWGYADDYERIPFKVFDLEIYRKKVS